MAKKRVKRADRVPAVEEGERLFTDEDWVCGEPEGHGPYCTRPRGHHGPHGCSLQDMTVVWEHPFVASVPRKRADG